jgi:TonB family protein
VIAHEHGHIRHGHVMRAITRRLSLGLLLGLVAGDQSALSGGLRAAGELGELSFSREHEREADDQAIELLARSGASPIALADALESIRKRAAPGGIPLGFLSTHPAPAERRARIRAAAASFTSHADGPAWRAGAGWQEMKAALAERPPHPGWADSIRTLIPGRRDRETAGSGEASAADGDGEPLPKFGDYIYVEELPEAITKVPPVYPELARRADVEGVVLVQALVGRDGRVKDTRVVKPIPALNEAAVAAVRQWVFKPALAGGKPVAVWVAIPVRFTLQ